MHLMVGIGYALAYTALSPLSDAHWNLHTGLQLSFLLLVPYRYWPALLVGEVVPNTVAMLRCIDAFGVEAVAWRCVPPILTIMPALWWCRERLKLFPTRKLVDIKVLMLCVMLASLVRTLYSYTFLLLVHTPAFKAHPIMALGYFIGNTIAVLGVVPMVLMVRLDIQNYGARALARKCIMAPLTADLMVVALPSMLLLTVCILRGGNDMQHIARIAMFLPVAWLTIKHGWRAAVAGGMLAIIATCLLTVSRPDPQLIETQAFIAFTIICLMATGARISAQLLREAKQKQRDANALATARRSLEAHEQRRKQLSTKLEHLALRLHVTNQSLAHTLRSGLFGVDAERYAKHVLEAPEEVYALAESLHPVAWRERGLPAALSQTIGRALDEASIEYRCVITGRGYIRMSQDTLNTVYRSACEAVVCVTSRLTCSSVSLTLRAGETRGHRWLVLVVDGHQNTSRMATAVIRKAEREYIAAKLGAGSLTVSELTELARLFGGQLHHRQRGPQERITILLHDTWPATKEVEHKPEPLQLWVS
ncbi:MASE1 domain-containing protein [Dyella choica]|nr:MASE1 domain-containing protein [Dyella choica]